MPVADPVCHCGVAKSRHRWEEHPFVEMPEEEPAPVEPDPEPDLITRHWRDGEE